jgi:hypothetical protein
MYVFGKLRSFDNSHDKGFEGPTEPVCIDVLAVQFWLGDIAEMLACYSEDEKVSLGKTSCRVE